MCAEASYPVIVYCASSNPIKKMYGVIPRNPIGLVENPE